MDAQEAVLRAQIPDHVHEWRWENPQTVGRDVVYGSCACGFLAAREHAYGVVIPDPDSEEQA